MDYQARSFSGILMNRIFDFFVFFFSVSLMFLLFLIIFTIVRKGMSVIDFDFLFMERRFPGSDSGGILKDIAGTVMLTALSVVFALPVGVLSGIYLAESEGARLCRIIKWGVDVLKGTPSVVLGIIVSILFVKSNMPGLSGLSGSIGLALILLPFIIESTEKSFRVNSVVYREGTASLGIPYYKSVLFVLLPSSVSGIIPGVLSGIVRITGETAVLVFTSFGNNFMNVNIMKPVNSLSLIIFNYAQDPSENSHNTAWGASLVLITVILLLNLISKMVVKKCRIKY